MSASTGIVRASLSWVPQGHRTLNLSVTTGCIWSGETKIYSPNWEMELSQVISGSWERFVCSQKWSWSAVWIEGHAGDGYYWRVASGASSVSCHVWMVISVAFSQHGVLSLGNGSTNWAGGFTVQGLQVPAPRHPELKWGIHRGFICCLPLLPPPQTEEAPCHPLPGWV